MSTKVCLYARRSVESGGSETTLQGQLDRMRGYCAKNNMQVVYEISEEKTGVLKFELRPEGRKILELARARQIDIVMIDESTRIGRDVQVYLDIIDVLEKHNVRVLDRSTGNFLSKGLLDIIQSAISENERERIKTRLTQGKRAKAQHSWIGFNTIFGYDKIGTGKNTFLQINESQAKTIRDIFDWYTSGRSRNWIANKLNQRGDLPARGSHWTITKVYNVLTNEFYTGEYKNLSWQCDVFYDEAGKKHSRASRVDSEYAVKIPQIISRETYRQASLMREKNTRFSRRNGKRFYLLSGRFKCDNCGGSVCGSYNGKHSYYNCTNHYHGKTCDTKGVSAIKVDAAVWKWIVSLIMTPGLVRREYEKQFAETSERRTELQEKLANYEKQIARINSELQRAFLAFTKEIVSEAIYTQTKNNLDLELGSYEKLLNDTKVEIASLNSLNEDDLLSIEECWQVLQAKLENIERSNEAKRVLLDRLDVQARLLVENGERKIKVTCKIGTDILSPLEDDESEKYGVEDFWEECELNLSAVQHQHQHPHSQRAIQTPIQHRQQQHQEDFVAGEGERAKGCVQRGVKLL